MSSKVGNNGGKDLDPIILRIRQLIEGLTHLNLKDKNPTILQTRILQRMHETGIQTLSEYWEFLNSDSDSERCILLSYLTTHHTRFFREFLQFEYIKECALKRIIDEKRRLKQPKKIRVWSAACSEGQETYSLALFLNYHLPRLAPDFEFELLGTDVDVQSLAIAKNGVYLNEDLAKIPHVYKRNLLMPGTEEIAQYSKFKDAVKSHCQFEESNLLKALTYPKESNWDMILCRNVFLYFTKAQIVSCINLLEQKLSPKGLFFIGLSENITNYKGGLNYLGRGIYTKNPEFYPSIYKPRPVKIFIVEDSPRVLKELTHILSPQNGFEIVGTASNGIEAARKMRHCSPDVMTLDVQMPVQTGMEYLKENNNQNHVPIVLFSRTEKDMSFWERLGVFDIVQKPDSDEIRSCARELRTKIKCAQLALIKAKDWNSQDVG